MLEKKYQKRYQKSIEKGIKVIQNINKSRPISMTDVHLLCRFEQRPITDELSKQLRFFLSNGVPATYTEEEAEVFARDPEGRNETETEGELTLTTTPLHMICASIPKDANEAEIEVISSMVDALLEYGAGWCLVDKNGDTPGCILVKREMKLLPVYNKIVEAGVRAELLLRKVEEVEFVDEEDWEADLRAGEEVGGLHGQDVGGNDENGVEDEKDQENESRVQTELDTEEPRELKAKEPTPWSEADPSTNQDTYLKSKVSYTEDALVTENKDGVMMEWETDLMKMGSDSLFKGLEEDPEVSVLNIGFGMGIIDSFIQKHKPVKHYICEAHPDVLAKLKRDGWYEKPGVVVLEGRWQDHLDRLLSDGVFFNGIYYDTYSERYEDMLELFDYVVGLLKPSGVFSFFNGLGADRQVVYDVYKELVTLDLANYGLECKFVEYEIPEQTMKKNDESVWQEMSREYWSCPVYYHPEASFADIE